MIDPIVALISSYKEDRLIQGCIRSVFPFCRKVIVYDGPTEAERIPGEETNLEGWRDHVIWEQASWENEHTKRTRMLNRAKDELGVPFWILTIDADEILIWGEYLVDWVNVLRPGYPLSQENVIPLKRTEAAWTTEGFYSDIAPSRLIHSSLVKEYLISCWKIATPDGKVFEAGHYQAPKMPMYGEPHIHHRHYLRREERRSFRAGTHGEEARYTEQIRKVFKENPPNLRLLEDVLLPEPEKMEE